MKGLFQKLSRCLHTWMDGRYGFDGLTLFYLCICVLFLYCAGRMPDGTVQTIIYLAAAALGVYALSRCFSKNTETQKKQWDRFQSDLDDIDYKLSLRLGVWKIRRGYRYIRCRQCGHRYRILRKKGKQAVFCPNCGSQRQTKFMR